MENVIDAFINADYMQQLFQLVVLNPDQVRDIITDIPGNLKISLLYVIRYIGLAGEDPKVFEVLSGYKGIFILIVKRNDIVSRVKRAEK